MASLDSGDGPAPEGWHQQDILAEIRKRGETVSSLSRAAGLRRGTLQTVFYKRVPKYQAIVAAFIGRTRHELWPHWYGPDDELLPLGGGNNRPGVAGEEAA